MTVTILIVDLAWSSLWVDKFYQLLSFLLLCEVRLGLMKQKKPIWRCWKFQTGNRKHCLKRKYRFGAKQKIDFIVNQMTLTRDTRYLRPPSWSCFSWGNVIDSCHDIILSRSVDYILTLESKKEEHFVFRLCHLHFLWSLVKRKLFTRPLCIGRL